MTLRLVPHVVETSVAAGTGATVATAALRPVADGDAASGGAARRRFTCARAEVEAESVAFAVSATHGLVTGEYTVPYVASWAGGDGGLVRDTGVWVLSCARQILAAATPADDGTVAAAAAPDALPALQKLADAGREPGDWVSRPLRLPRSRSRPGTAGPSTRGRRPPRCPGAGCWSG